MLPLSPAAKSRRSYHASSRANNGNEVSVSASPSTKSSPILDSQLSPLALKPEDPQADSAAIQHNFRQLGDDLPANSVPASVASVKSPTNKSNQVAPMNRHSSSTMSLSPVHTARPSDTARVSPYQLEDDFVTEIDCDCACFNFFNRLVFGTSPEPRQQVRNPSIELKRAIHIRPHLTTPPPPFSMPKVAKFTKRHATMDPVPHLPEASNSADTQVNQALKRRSFTDFSSDAVDHSSTSYLLNNMPSFVNHRLTTGDMTFTRLRTEEMVTLTRQRTEDMVTLTRQRTEETLTRQATTTQVLEHVEPLSRQVTSEMTLEQDSCSVSQSPRTITKIV